MTLPVDILRYCLKQYGAFSLYADANGNAPILVNWEQAVRLYPHPEILADRKEILRTGTKTLEVTIKGNQMEIRRAEHHLVETYPLAETE